MMSGDAPAMVRVRVCVWTFDRDSRDHAIARYRELESMNNPNGFRPTMNPRSEAIVKRRRQMSRNNSVASSLTHDLADTEVNSQTSTTRSLNRPSSAPARGRQRVSHFDTRDFDAALHEALYKDATDRQLRLQQLREVQCIVVVGLHVDTVLTLLLLVPDRRRTQRHRLLNRNLI